MRVYILVILFVCKGLTPNAQLPYAVGSVTGDIQFPAALNTASFPASLMQVKQKLVILDFFGTWCAPCVRALPNLKALQEKFKEEVLVLLVSAEDEQLLRNFIKKQAGFNLVMLADSDSAISKKFRPPYYPYSLVLNQESRVVAIPSQGQITEMAIRGWLEGHDIPAAPGDTDMVKNESVSVMTNRETNSEPAGFKTSNPLIQLSQDFLYAVKTGDTTDTYIQQLKSISPARLVESVHSDDEKKAFWVNLYNAYTQVFLKQNPDQYKRRGRFFGNRAIEIAGYRFSLDDIEHGILRRSKIKWSLGYLGKLFPGKNEKLLRVNKPDYRIHFALNCGAKSCPPVAFYKPENIHQQLELATRAYLSGEVQYDEAANRVSLPAIMGWFRRDFGGKKKMKILLQRLSIIPEGKDPRIRFSKYDWTLYLENYK